ncbi:unnamed protein product [Aspergillus oryzae RIB40]|uniref:DNA, SC003 n=1 Tax=Aspergillus oryzae (strain ATCC 42149 / RIB 40) TaxID=510516 RepID=Q2UJR2_ASPOR|nr:unnamed protein product [Aspergillus oryzae RIB40]BAE58203.1 unnamed protein product [Aspergillus oryzae RIB40]
MSSAEESPAQRAARLRRERREAKIKEGGAARLDKITSLSGRTPASTREEVSPSPSPSPQPPAQISSTERPQPTPGPAPTSASASVPAPAPASAPAQPMSNPEPQSPENLQAQQELFRALLRQGGPSSSEQGPQEEDPTMQMLNTLMAGMNGQEQVPGGAAGGPSQAELVSALGFPPFVADLLGAATHKPTDEEKKDVRTWKVLHILFAVAVGIYLLMLIGTSVSTYGSQPPPPATAQNPFLYFTTGEVVLTGARLMSKGRTGRAAGIMLGLQLFQDIVRDGSLVVFLLGMGAWWSL